MLELMSSDVRGFRCDVRIVKKRNVDEIYGAIDAYEHLAPVNDTDRAIEWLTRLFEQNGANFVTETLVGDLFDQEPSLRAKYKADVIINAIGLAGTELASDTSCYPVDGGLLRLINNGSDFPKLDHALRITVDAVHDSNEIVFIVPRNKQDSTD